VTEASCTEVFVVGGGPAGLSAAIAARRRGFDVVLADCAAPPIDKACGEGIMPDGVAAARSLGLDLQAAAGHPFRGIRFIDSESSVEARFPDGAGIGIPRTELHRLMVEEAIASGVRLEWNTRIHGILPDGSVQAGGREVRAKWIVGADGAHSRVRWWAGLDTCRSESRRYGFRRHYEGVECGDYMELHWGEGYQLYLTPVAAGEICVVLISRNPRLRLQDALPRFPLLDARLAAGRPMNQERGAVTISRRLRTVTRGNVALVGDASGSVDAITGEGLCLLSQQALALADAMAEGDLRSYQREHRRIGWRAAQMSGLLLLLDAWPRLRARVLRAMAADPRLFAHMLAIHVGELPARDFIGNGMALAWRMLSI
jgi:menaquinone-9 beta-reductase